MNRTIESLPHYLRQYVVEQTGDSYTTRDHAAWRYIMRQARDYFKDHAVPIYLDGLGRTYYHKRLDSGDSTVEALRCLKRRLVRIVFHALHADQQPLETPASLPLAA